MGKGWGKKYRAPLAKSGHAADCLCAGDHCGQNDSDRATRRRKGERARVKSVRPVHPNSIAARKMGRTDWL